MFQQEDGSCGQVPFYALGSDIQQFYYQFEGVELGYFYITPFAEG